MSKQSVAVEKSLCMSKMSWFSFKGKKVET